MAIFFDSFSPYPVYGNIPMPTFKPKSGLSCKFFQITLLQNGKTYATMNLHKPVSFIAFLSKIESRLLDVSDPNAKGELKVFDCGYGQQSAALIHVKFNTIYLTEILNVLKNKVSMQ